MTAEQIIANTLHADRYGASHTIRIITNLRRHGYEIVRAPVAPPPPVVPKPDLYCGD